jgi:hypothetical protein
VETIKIRHGNGVVTELPAINILELSEVETEPDRRSFYFTILRPGWEKPWKIGEFPSNALAQAERDRVANEYGRIFGGDQLGS